MTKRTQPMTRMSMIPRFYSFAFSFLWSRLNLCQDDNAENGLEDIEKNTQVFFQKKFLVWALMHFLLVTGPEQRRAQEGQERR